MNYRSRALPSGGSAVLNAWRSQHGPEAQRIQALAGRGGQWSVNPYGRLQQLAGNGARPLRSYMAASNDRLVADLVTQLGDVSGNAEVRMGLRAMRRRSRQLANDNEWVRRFLQLLRDNVIGARGFNLQSKIYKARKRDGVAELDVDANAVIEEAYATQSKLGNFSACGKYNRATFERAMLTGLARDGECIVEKIVGAAFGPFGLAWRMVDPDLLDDTLNIGTNGTYPGHGRLDAGNDIRMGVERNGYGRPVAYWFLAVHPGDDVHNVAAIRHRRVPADRVLHLFIAEDLRPDTARGVPWIYTAIRRMAMLGGFEEAALVNARTGASKMGFYQPPAATGGGAIADAGTANGEGVSDGKDADGNLITEAEPGTFGVLPAGWDFKTWDPAYPNESTDPFVKGMLRAFSSACGLTYNTIGNDLAGVSLSAMRHGANQDRDTYESIQQYFRDHACVPMFEPWLALGLGLGRIGRLPPDGFDRFNKPRFIARPFRSPDPQKDVAAGAQEVALGTNSRTRLCAEKGLDFDEVLDELAEEEAKAKAKGVTLNTAAASASKNPAVDDVGKPAKPGAEGANGTNPDATDEEGNPDDTAAE
jgi:lambda family phage portal protein